MAIKERRLRKWDWSYKLPDKTILQDDVIVREISAREVVGQDSECCFEILCYLRSARFTISSLKGWSYFCIFSRCHRLDTLRRGLRVFFYSCKEWVAEKMLMEAVKIYIILDVSISKTNINLHGFLNILWQCGCCWWSGWISNGWV